MTKKPDPIYYNEKTGELVTVTKAQAKDLPDEYKKLQFVKNDKGVDVMRMSFTDDSGNAVTVDVSEATPEEAAAHDDKDTK